MRTRNLFAALFLIVMICYPFSIASADQQNSPATVTTRSASFTIKVVMLGIDEKLIDKDYMTWNSPERRYQLYQIPGLSTNTEYSLNYEYVFPGNSFTDDFAKFLDSIQKRERFQNVIWNLSYFQVKNTYQWNYTHFPVRSTNTYYAADAAESWLVEQKSAYGGLPENGYVLVLADLSTRLPSTTVGQFDLALQGKDVEFTPHFYNKTYRDNDLGIELNRRYMTAWGGHSRIFFIDLSAGPEKTLEQLPIQIASAVNSVNLSSAYGKVWINQFLADYVYGAVYNLFTPDFVYPINFSYSYKVKVVVLDNRTDTADPPITSTFNPEDAVKEWQALIPWAKVTAETKYVRVGDYPELQKAIVDATNSVQYGSPPGTRSVDARPVYEWLSQSGKGHIKDFMEVTRDLDEFDIPVFAFAFSGDYEFGFTYKESVADNPDFDRTIWGVALYDLVLISHSTFDFKRGDTARIDTPQPGKGFGFTNTVIHEVGHMVGLMHPFSYDPTENFVASVMAYYPYENSFSIFDQDALTRGEADLLLRETTQLLAETPWIMINQLGLSTAKSKLETAEKAYSQMNYADAVKNGIDALLSAARAHMIGGGLIPAWVFPILQAVGAFVLGVALTALLFLTQRRHREVPRPRAEIPQVGRCSTCGKQLTWISEYERWYCYSCERYQ